MTKSNTYTTSDIALAAFLKLKGLVLVECSREDKFHFAFSDPDNQAEKLAIEFINSDMRKYDDEMRSLKKVIYSKK
jgi:hypothetical protein